jgi:hypothetical protein
MESAGMTNLPAQQASRVVSLPSLREPVAFLIRSREHSAPGTLGEWYPRTVPETATAGLARLIECLAARSTPATVDAITTILARRAVHFKNERTSAEWRLLFEDYCADLAEFSADHIAEAVRDQRREKPYFPKVSELVARCNALRAVEGEEARRARVLLGIEAPYFWETDLRQREEEHTKARCARANSPPQGIC